MAKIVKQIVTLEYVINTWDLADEYDKSYFENYFEGIPFEEQKSSLEEKFFQSDITLDDLEMTSMRFEEQETEENE